MKALDKYFKWIPLPKQKPTIPTKEYLKKRLKEIKREMDPLSWTQLTLVTVVFTLFMIYPLFSVMYTAFFYGGEFSLIYFQILFSDPFYWPLQVTFTDTFPFVAVNFRVTGQFILIGGDTLYVGGVDLGVIMNSLFIAVMTTILSTIIGVLVAFIMARYKFPGKLIISTFLIIPLLSTPFVGSIGLKYMISRMGVINQIFYYHLHIFPYRIVFTGLMAIVVVQSLHFFTLVYLNAYTSFINIDPSLEEQAENLGARGFKLFRTVTFPLALPGIQAGSILTFILSIEDVGTPIVFQEYLQARKTMAYQIFIKIFSPTGDINPVAPAIGTILLVFAIIGFLVIRKYVALRNYAMISKGGVWNPRTKDVGRIGEILILLFFIVVISIALIPHIGVFLLSIAQEWLTGAIFPTKWGIQNYVFIFTYPDVFNAIKNSFIYSTVATFFMIIIGTSAAYIVARKKIPGITLLDVISTIPIAIPGVVIAIGYFTGFLGTPLDPLANPAPLLIIAYTVRRITFTVRAAYSGLIQTHEELEEVSLNLGANKTQTFFRIVIPLIGISILAGAMMSFVYAMAETSTSIILGGANQDYAPITWKIQDVLFEIAGGPYVAAALGMLLMILQAIAIALVNTILKQRASVITGL
ncbi:MAG: iron ABC transporter permease [Candidatus Odinarchaeota archaeon]|nr:iron ABC transporter permease [Candidatus Odinarchaeota archaeon]